jgi:Domain of unknown function (DUF4157)
MKFRKSRKIKGGSSTTQKSREPFLRPKEGNESSFLRPQAKMLARNDSMPETVQTKMEQGIGEDFSSVKIHSHSSSAAEMGAMAYTNGENVHFAPGMYNPHTASGQELIGHELTHVKQQRQGKVQPGIQAKGLSLNNDRSLEAEADHFGKKAANGSSELYIPRSRLENSATPKRASSGIVQMMPKTDYGEFKTTTYTDVSNYGLEIKLEFHPKTKVDATKIGLIQTVNSQLDGKNMLISPTRANRQTSDGTRIDRVDKKNNPVYGSEVLNNQKDLGSTANSYENYKLGYRKKDSSGKWIDKPAILKDTPKMSGSGNNSHQKFETAALALSGTQKDMYYGSVNWGWEKDSKGVFKKLPVTLASKGDMPTAGFGAAAKKWNETAAIGTIKTIGNPTKVYDTSFKLVEITIRKNTIVKLGKVYVHSGDTYSEISDSKGKSLGLVKTRDLVDIGDGPKTIDLPIPWRGTVDTTYMATLRQGKSKESATLADLPKGIKVTVINDQSGWLKVHLDPTQKGLVINTLGKKSIDAANLLRGYISKELVKR